MKHPVSVPIFEETSVLDAKVKSPRTSLCSNSLVGKVLCTAYLSNLGLSQLKLQGSYQPIRPWTIS